MPISIHALREEGDGGGIILAPAIDRFLSTPSARRATGCCMSPRAGRQISIHALREEGDRTFAARHIGGEVISIHALREEGDHDILEVLAMENKFLSTPSARRATLS